MQIRNPTSAAGLALFLAAWIPCSAAAEDAEKAAAILPASETSRLMDLEGRKVVVHGRVESTGKSPGGTNIVNFRGAEFSLVAFRSDLDQFPEGEPADLYEGQRLAVEGVVAVYRGKPQIKLTSPAQIRVLGEEEEFPPKAEHAPTVAATAPEVEGPEDGVRAPETAGEAAAEEQEMRRPPVDPALYFR